MSIQRNDWSLQRKGIIDQERHKERVKEAIRKNLGSIVSNESIILSDGRRTVKVPIRSLDEYKFRFDYRKRKQVGQGNGKTRVGDVIAREGQPGQGQGSGQPGQEAGADYYEAEVNIDELAALIFEDLNLPFLEEKAKKAVQAKTTRFNEIRRTGVMANLDKRRMILENIKRNAREAKRARFGDVKKEDLRFKTWEEDHRYESNAVVMALMDVSGCFTAGHLIEMADGSYKDIAEIRRDDRVACVDLNTYEKTVSNVSATFTKTAPRTHIIKCEDATLRATPAHVFFVYDESGNRLVEKRADELADGDKLVLVNAWGRSGEAASQQQTLTSEQSYLLSVLQLTFGGSHVSENERQPIQKVLDSRLTVSKIKSIAVIDDPVRVYDFEVAGHHNYIVDGILSHNSMGEFKKYIARSFYFWMVRFLRTKYDNVEIVFISHHTEAKEVTEEQFFTQGESGGTVVSSAYQLALDIIKSRYHPGDWNVYPFHFSDGDNYYSDNEEAVRLADELITTCNLFGYGEIGEEGTSGYRRSSGALLSIFNDRLSRKERFIGVRIDDKEDVYPALKQFFGQRGVEA
jgi:uncharacterized sporulation protein YeaH/YhbH (DUF444 family)